MISVVAACRDLAHAPSQQALFDALEATLPKTLSVLEHRLNEALTGPLPRRLKHGAWEVAIDWHLVPYYGQPHKSRNEIYYGQPKQGTKNFHAYATICILQYGQRYTLGCTWVRRHEALTTAIQRLLAKVREKGVKIRRVLLDRAFFNVPVIELLQQEQLPFLMPVMFRGRPPKKGKPKQGLHWIKQQPAGWYKHTLKNGKRTVTISVCVGYRTHKNRTDKKRVQQKLLFGAWRVRGTPTDIREQYRKRFGIESSYRQMRQAKIYTCTRNPHLRFVFVALALILRNLWVWLHGEKIGDGRGARLTLRLERLRFKRMLDWIAHAISVLLHDGTTPCAVWET
jgi:putative transposase